MYRGTIKKVISGIILLFTSVLSANEEVVLDCVIEPSMLVEQSSQVRGVLETVDVDRGEFVKKGQLVARLMSGVEKAGVQLSKDRAEMEVDIMSRKAEQQFRRNTLKQVEQLYQKKLASHREYDDAKTSSVVADVELEKAIELKHLAALELQRSEEVLKLRSMHSMIDGVVIEVMKSPGEYVEEQPVMKIARIDPLFVEVIVPESMMGGIVIGQQFKINIEIPNNASYLGTVSVVDQVIDASSGTFGVRLNLPNPGNKIHAGQRCKIVLLDETFVEEDKKPVVLQDTK